MWGITLRITCVVRVRNCFPVIGLLCFSFDHHLATLSNLFSNFSARAYAPLFSRLSWDYNWPCTTRFTLRKLQGNNPRCVCELQDPYQSGLHIFHCQSRHAFSGIFFAMLDHLYGRPNPKWKRTQVRRTSARVSI